MVDRVHQLAPGLEQATRLRLSELYVVGPDSGPRLAGCRVAGGSARRGVAMGMGLIASFGAFPNAQLAWLSAMLFACWVPLLWFNWPPAKLFMGDAGAIPLGFVLALMGLMAFLTDPSLGFAWLILMMPFLVDTGLTLCIRVFAGEPPHVAHRDHAYQRLSMQMGSPLPVTLGLLGMQVIWQFPLAVTAVNSAVFPPLLVFLSAMPSVATVVHARLRA